MIRALRLLMPNEGDTCRKFVVARLQAVGRDTDPHRVSERVTFTDGRIGATGGNRHLGSGERADYLPRYRPDLSIGVVEAKASNCDDDDQEEGEDYDEIPGHKLAQGNRGSRG